VNAAEPIVEVTEIPPDSTVLFTIRHRETGERGEAILVSSGEDVLAWRNCCQHQRHVRLDDGDGATMRDGELVCTRHGATFEAENGSCTYGPCAGATLEAVGIAVEDGTVHLTDDAWDFLGLGRDAVDPADLSTTNAPGF
jgi:nitrite reductase/ring-hydroxylating ferredoxin subunit